MDSFYKNLVSSSELTNSVYHRVAPRVCLWNPESETLECNSAQGIRNPSNDWSPESKFHWQEISIPVPGILNPERGIQIPRLDYFAGANHEKIKRLTFTGPY